MSRSVLNSITVAFTPQVLTSNSINSIHLSLAIEMLLDQIRDIIYTRPIRFFSLGLPALQVEQSFSFIAPFIPVVCSIFCGASAIFLVSLRPDYPAI